MITLPGEGSLRMEVELNCDFATVYVLDSYGYEVATFENVKIKGDTTELCADSGSFDGRDIRLPGGYNDGTY